MFQNFLFCLRLTGLPLLPVEGIYCPIDFGGGVLAHGLVELFGNVIELHLLLGLAHCGNDFVLDEGANLLYLFVAEHYCAYHLFVGNFVGARLYH